jgi:cell wall-associated NlpC family hydrolase
MMHIDYAREWLGTPFHAQGQLKGVGVDCCHVVFDSLARCGIIQPIMIPCYKLDNVTDPGSVVYPMLLDSVIFTFDGRVRHISIATSDNTHIHTSIRFGVVEDVITDGFKSRLTRIHRIIRHG